MHPLWEYPAYPRSDVIKLMTFNLSSPVPSTPIRAVGTIDLTHPPINGSTNTSSEGGGGGDGSRRCNGVVMWMDYQLTDQHISTTGLVKVWRMDVYMCVWKYEYTGYNNIIGEKGNYSS